MATPSDVRTCSGIFWSRATCPPWSEEKVEDGEKFSAWRPRPHRRSQSVSLFLLIHLIGLSCLIAHLDPALPPSAIAPQLFLFLSFLLCVSPDWTCDQARVRTGSQVLQFHRSTLSLLVSCVFPLNTSTVLPPNGPLDLRVNSLAKTPAFTSAYFLSYVSVFFYLREHF